MIRAAMVVTNRSGRPISFVLLPDVDYGPDWAPSRVELALPERAPDGVVGIRIVQKTVARSITLGPGESCRAPERIVEIPQFARARRAGLVSVA